MHKTHCVLRVWEWREHWRDKFQNECGLGAGKWEMLRAWYVSSDPVTSHNHTHASLWSVPLPLKHQATHPRTHTNTHTHTHTHTHSFTRVGNWKKRGNSCAELIPGRCAATIVRVWMSRESLFTCRANSASLKHVRVEEHSGLSWERVNMCFGIKLHAKEVSLLIWNVSSVNTLKVWHCRRHVSPPFKHF